MRLTSVLAFALAAATLTSPALAQQKRPMTFADLQALHRISDPQISPSGKWVLFSVTDANLDKNSKTNNLWIVPLAGGKEVQLTKTDAGASNGRFSPDGKWVSFTHPASTGQAQIWIAPFHDNDGTIGDDYQVTALVTGADGAIWSPDSKHILFTSSVYPECESKAPIGPAHNDEEANCNSVHEDAAKKNPTQARIFDSLLYRHWNQYMGPTHSHIFYADVTGGTHNTPTDLTPASVIGDHEAPTFSLGGPLGYAFAPDGKEIAYVVNLDKVPAESTNNDIFILNPEADPHTAKKVSTSPGSDDGPQYSPDGKYLAWRSQARNGYESDKFDLVVMDRATGVISAMDAQTLIGSRYSGWVDEFTWAPNSASVVFSSALEGEQPIFSASVGYLVGKEIRTPSQRLMVRETKGGEYSGIQLFAKDRTSQNVQLVSVQMTISSPAQIVKTDLLGLNAFFSLGLDKDERKAEFILTDGYAFQAEMSLTHLNDDLLSRLDLPKQESFWFPGANGTKVQGFLIRPPNFDPAKKYPVKFLIHGGPQGAWGDAWSYRWNPELFAANGYVVVMVNPRGSTGYGQKFLEQVSGDWGGRPYIDLMKGMDYAEAKYPFIDKTRECALGASYGGFMADWILTHTHRFACIVTHDGMYNPQSAFGTTEELWFNEWEFRPLASAAPDAVVEQTKPSHPWDFYDKPAAQDPFRKWSPMLNIKNAKTPTLVIHGQRDYRLDVSEGLQLFDSLQILGVPSKMLYFPDEGHWVLKPKNSELWYSTVNDWVDQWTHTNKYAATDTVAKP